MNKTLLIIALILTLSYSTYASVGNDKYVLVDKIITETSDVIEVYERLTDSGTIQLFVIENGDSIKGTSSVFIPGSLNEAFEEGGTHVRTY